jgi:hypothetical protein
VNVTPAGLGHALAEQGMARTLAAEHERWIHDAIDALQRFGHLPGWHQFKAEDFRIWWLGNGGSEPHDHHCWGAITSRACRAGLIRFTGRFAPSVSPATRGHYVRIWEIVA